MMLPTPAEAIRLFRSETNSPRIPELNSTTVLLHQGSNWIGLYADGRLLGIVSDHCGVWEAIPLTDVKRYLPYVFKELCYAHLQTPPHLDAYWTKDQNR